MEIAKNLHSYLSPKCEVLSAGNCGQGVFAVERIDEGEMISVWGGKIFTVEDIDELEAQHPHLATHPVTVANGFYLGSTSHEQCDEAEMFNHSCDPNAGVKGQIVLVTRRSISAGEEICFDYGTTEVGSESFECRCGSSGCRRTIDGNAWKDAAFQERNRGYLSWLVEEMIRLEEDD